MLSFILIPFLLVEEEEEGSGGGEETSPFDLLFLESDLLLEPDAWFGEDCRTGGLEGGRKGREKEGGRREDRNRLREER